MRHTRNLRGLLGIAVSALALPLLAVPAASSMATAPAVTAALPATAKVMVVGDSISHGHEGDYTWRYRLKSHLGAGVDFVGPWTGTNTLPDAYPAGWPSTPSPVSRSGAYRGNMTFDSQHLAQWGWQMAQAKSQVGAQVSTYQPDVLLVELGFNDLAWGVASPEQTVNNLRDLIAAARGANPDVHVAVANVVQRSPLSNVPNLPTVISEYNTRLADAVWSLGTAQSPVSVVDINGPWDYSQDTYDGLHPNVRGEYVIAKAFADVIARDWGLGSSYGTIPTSLPADLGVTTPGTPTATPAGVGLKLAWPRVFGATAYQYFVRNATLGQAFQRSQYDINAQSWTENGFPAGHRLEFYVKAVRGSSVSAASPVVSANVPPMGDVTGLTAVNDPAKPYTVKLTWNPVANADDYQVWAAPGCDILPPDISTYKLIQWNLGAKTTWTHEYVLDACMNYTVVASRYGGIGRKIWGHARGWPHQNNFYHLLARNRYMDTAADSGDQKATTNIGGGTDRGVVVVRGFIRNKDTQTLIIGDGRSFQTNPYASSKIGVAYDTKTGDVGVYVHKSCALLNSIVCVGARPISFVANASTVTDSNRTAVNYVTATKSSTGVITVKVSAINSYDKVMLAAHPWIGGLGRINATITLTPSGGTYRATLVGDKFPSWEIFRYPRTGIAPAGQMGETRIIGTRDQTSIGDLKGTPSTCTSPASENTGPTNAMSC